MKNILNNKTFFSFFLLALIFLCTLFADPNNIAYQEVEGAQTKATKLSNAPRPEADQPLAETQTQIANSNYLSPTGQTQSNSSNSKNANNNQSNGNSNPSAGSGQAPNDPTPTSAPQEPTATPTSVPAENTPTPTPTPEIIIDPPYPYPTCPMPPCPYPVQSDSLQKWPPCPQYMDMVICPDWEL